MHRSTSLPIPPDAHEGLPDGSHVAWLQSAGCSSCCCPCCCDRDIAPSTRQQHKAQSLGRLLVKTNQSSLGKQTSPHSTRSLSQCQPGNRQDCPACSPGQAQTSGPWPAGHSALFAWLVARVGLAVASSPLQAADLAAPPAVQCMLSMLSTCASPNHALMLHSALIMLVASSHLRMQTAACHPG